MTSPDKPQKFADKLALWIRNNFTLLFGLIVGIFLTIMMVLASGAQRDTLDDVVALYNKYWDGAVKMKAELDKKGLLKKNPWKDGFQELEYYLWHHVGRRARQGAAMNAPDYAHWYGFFQVFQVYYDMENIYKWRLKNNKIEEMSTVMSSAPY